MSEPWDRLPRESSKAYAAFAAYRQEHAALAAEFEASMRGELPAGCQSACEHPEAAAMQGELEAAVELGGGRDDD